MKLNWNILLRTSLKYMFATHLELLRKWRSVVNLSNDCAPTRALMMRDTKLLCCCDSDWNQSCRPAALCPLPGAPRIRHGRILHQRIAVRLNDERCSRRDRLLPDPPRSGPDGVRPELKGSIGEGPNHSNHSNHSNSFKIQEFSLENYQKFQKISTSSKISAKFR